MEDFTPVCNPRHVLADLYELRLSKIYRVVEINAAYTHTHNRFTALLEFVRDYPGEQVTER